MDELPTIDGLGSQPGRAARNASDVAIQAKQSASAEADINSQMQRKAAEDLESKVEDALESNGLPNIESDELRSFLERFRALESKVGFVDTMHDLHKSTNDALSYKHALSASFSPGELAESNEFDFWRDALFFMHRVRASYQRLQSFNDMRKSRMEELNKRRKHSETDTIRETTTKAFMRGERAKLLQVDWDTLINNKPDPNASVLCPIEIVSSDPDPRILSQLEISLLTKKKRNKTQKLEGVERSLPAGKNGTLNVQNPLPERIRMTSASLLSIMETFDPPPDFVLIPSGKTVVFLRPFQHLVFNEGLLRERLTSLEERYENYDPNEVQPSPETATQQEGTITSEHVSSSPGGASASATDAPISGQKAAEAVKSGESMVNDENTELGAEEDKKDKGDNEASGDIEVQTSITALLHLRCLMEFIDSELLPKEKYIRSDSCTHVYFHDLWHLFRPGDELMDQDGRQAYVVLRVQVPSHRTEDPWEQWNKKIADNDSDAGSDIEDGNPFTIYCAYIDFDGKSFGPVKMKFDIPPFGDRKAVRSLPVYPFRLAKGSENRQKFLDRGRMLLDVAKFKAMYYMGMTVDGREEVDSQVVIDFNEALADETRREAWEPPIRPLNTAAEDRSAYCGSICCDNEAVSGGHVVDSALTQRYVKTLLPNNSLAAPSLILSPRSLEETLERKDQLTDTELLIMTCRVFGFILRSRKWAQLDLNLLRYENVGARDQKVGAFDRLELPLGHREMVKSLVIQHFRSKKSILARDDATDLVQGKGRGLILLLHGAPGVGKTTTAEGIAELFKKPLFQITCGDLGTTAKEVEAELEKNFALASRWGCILLLDEADVFLAARERTDFQRNGLVAVFLRVLEYYTGILFLTTNRVGDFDEAFASRIHMSLYYPELDEDKTLKVFRLNLDLIQERFDKHGRKIIFDMSSIEDFAQQHFQNNKYNRWNGRQIRNACQTALALAEFDAQGSTLDIESELDKDAVVRLELKYFKTVQRAYLEFGHYLGDIQGTQGDRRAIDLKLRARTNTPYEGKRNLFSQREDSRSGTKQNLSPQYRDSRVDSSGVSQHGYGFSEGSYGQGYMPVTPSPGRPQGYGQYPSYPQHPQHPQPMQGFQGPLGHASQGSSMDRASGVTEPPEPGQMDPRFSHGRSPSQLESLSTFNPSMYQPGYQPGYQQQREAQGEPRNFGMGQEASPFAQRGPQNQ